MPVHDWTRVSAGTFHAFHNSWITHLQEALNGGLLPDGYYALGEQRSGDIGPDLLTLHEDASPSDWQPQTRDDDGGLVAVAEHPPQVSLALEAAAEAAFYLAKQRSLVIYHASGDRMVALVEIVSPANKHSRQTTADFVATATAALADGYHLLVIDLLPPGRHDPQGVHGLIWEHLADELWESPVDRPLTLASYSAGRPIKAYVEPSCVGRPLLEMPLFLTATHYLNVPLESTYLAAYRGIPQRWRRVIEADGEREASAR